MPLFTLAIISLSTYVTLATQTNPTTPADIDMVVVVTKQLHYSPITADNRIWMMTNQIPLKCSNKKLPLISHTLIAALQSINCESRAHGPNWLLTGQPAGWRVGGQPNIPLYTTTPFYATPPMACATFNQPTFYIELYGTGFRANIMRRAKHSTIVPDVFSSLELVAL